MMTDAERQAAELLVHYFNQAGVVTHNDNRIEIRQIVHLILAAAQQESKHT